jgi:uncharacterized peroxidase-related enzyme
MSANAVVDRFEIHDPTTAPEPSRPVLEAARGSYGFVPNLLGVLASSPVALRAYTTLAQILEDGTLTPAERQVVLLTVSVTNRCRYCVGAHTALAASAGVPEEALAAIREQRSPADRRLGALSTVTRRLVEERGWLRPEDVDSFLQAGFHRDQLLEVITALAFKTLSNYTNHLAETPLDAAFQKTEWAPPEEV